MSSNAGNGAPQSFPAPEPDSPAFAAYFDHTLLKLDATEGQIDILCEEARRYGFKVSERAVSGPRMQWMRLRPQDPSELDAVDWRGRWYKEDDEDDYDDSEEGQEDRPMEDFDVSNFIHYGWDSQTMLNRHFESTGQPRAR